MGEFKRKYVSPKKKCKEKRERGGGGGGRKRIRDKLSLYSCVIILLSHSELHVKLQEGGGIVV
jgi:hypothetical protein